MVLSQLSYHLRLVVIFSDDTFKIDDGKTTFGFMMCLDGPIILTRATCGPKVHSIKEAEARAAPNALSHTEEMGLSKVCILSDAIEMVQVINGPDWPTLLLVGAPLSMWILIGMGRVLYNLFPLYFIWFCTNVGLCFCFLSLQ